MDNESLVPEIHVSRITLQSSKDNKLIANIQFALKEQAENSEISQWLKDKDILKFLKILVIQSTNEANTQEIINKKQLIAQALVSSADNRAIYEVLQQNPAFIRTKTISLLDSNIENIQERVIETNGANTLNIYIDTTFDALENITENPQHLSYIFGVYFDLSEFFTNLNISESEMQFINNLIPYEFKVEYVINNSNLITTNFIFVKEDGNIWSGQVHQKLQNGLIIYRSGETETNTSVNLIKLEIDNLKVQDYRQLKNIIDISQFTKDITDATGVIKIQNIISDDFTSRAAGLSLKDQEPNNSFISDLFWSIDKTDNISLTFFIDYKQLFLKNSFYGQTISKIDSVLAQNFINSFYEKAFIERLIIKSKRIDIPDIQFSDEHHEKIVVDLNKTGLLQSKHPAVFTDSRRIQTYSVVQNNSKKYGIYEYSVEIDYKDNVVEQIETIISALQAEQKMFKEYYEFSLLPNVFNQVTNKFNVSLLGSFSFYSKIATTPLLEVAPKLLETMSDLYYFDEDINTAALSVNNLITILQNYVRPVNATPQSIGYVVELYDTVIDVLNKFIGKTTITNNSSIVGTVSQSSVSSVSKTIKIAKKFTNKIDLNSSYKLEYLNFNLQNSTNTTFSSDIVYEAHKTDLINKKLFSVGKFISKNNSSEQKTEVFEKLYNILGDLGNLKITAKTGGLLQDVNVATTQINLFPNIAADLLNDSIIQQTSISDEELTQQQKTSLIPSISSLFNSTLNKSATQLEFITSDRLEKNYLSNLGRNAYVANVAVNIPNIITNSNYSTNVKYVKELFGDGTSVRVSQIKELPNQIKTLINIKLASEITFSDGKVRFDYEMLKCIKVLKGFLYDNKEQTYLMNEPIWEILKKSDLSIFENIQNRTNTRFNKAIFCKLEDYSNSNIRYKFNQALRDTTTNETFFINLFINDSFNVLNGATRIPFSIFSTRIEAETNKYFTSDFGSIQISVGNEIINPDDSIDNTKYSFLSPLGFYFDNLYRTLETKTVNPVDIIIRDNPLNIEPEFIQTESFSGAPSIIDRVRTIRETSAALTQRLLDITPGQITSYSRNDGLIRPGAASMSRQNITRPSDLRTDNINFDQAQFNSNDGIVR